LNEVLKVNRAFLWQGCQYPGDAEGNNFQIMLNLLMFKLQWLFPLTDGSHYPILPYGILVELKSLFGTVQCDFIQFLMAKKYSPSVESGDRNH
jgi:hypothetical protein